MKSPSLKGLRLKSLSNPALTMKKAHSSILRGNKSKLQRKVIPKKNELKRKVHWVMKRKMGISTKCSIVIDMISRLILQLRSHQCWKKLVKMKSPSLKCLRSKSLSNPALTMKKAHSIILRGNKRKLQRKGIPKKNKLKRKVHWVMTRKMGKVKSQSLKCLWLKSLWNQALTRKKAHSSIVRGNKKKLQRKVILKQNKWKRKSH